MKQFTQIRSRFAVINTTSNAIQVSNTYKENTMKSRHYSFAKFETLSNAIRALHTYKESIMKTRISSFIRSAALLSVLLLRFKREWSFQ